MQSYPPVLSGLLCRLPGNPTPVQMAQLPAFLWDDLGTPRAVSYTFFSHPLLLYRHFLSFLRHSLGWLWDSAVPCSGLVGADWHDLLLARGSSRLSCSTLVPGQGILTAAEHQLMLYSVTLLKNQQWERNLPFQSWPLMAEWEEPKGGYPCSPHQLRFLHSIKFRSGFAWCEFQLSGMETQKSFRVKREAEQWEYGQRCSEVKGGEDNPQLGHRSLFAAGFENTSVWCWALKCHPQPWLSAAWTSTVVSSF